MAKRNLRTPVRKRYRATPYGVRVDVFGRGNELIHSSYLPDSIDEPEQKKKLWHRLIVVTTIAPIAWFLARFIVNNVQL